MNAAPERHSGSSEASGPPTLETLPKSLLGAIARQIIAQESPLFDRGDMLRLAATLALVGSRPTALMAHALFKHLSPRLGLKLPCGMNEASNVRDMRELLKSWGVTHSGAAYGRKTDLWAAIQAQIKDSALDAAGRPPRRCLVSAATRRELSRYSARLISARKAMDAFALDRDDLESLTFVRDGEANDQPLKMVLLADVKALALQKHGNWQELQRKRGIVTPKDPEKAKEGDQRKAALRMELAKRNVPPVRTETLLSLPRAFRYFDQEYPEFCATVEAAANQLERWGFFIAGPARQHYLDVLAQAAVERKRQQEKENSEERESSDDEAAPSSAATKRDQAMGAALPRWVAQQRNLMFILGNPEVPRCMLPELRRIYEDQQQALQVQQAQQARQAQHEHPAQKKRRT